MMDYVIEAMQQNPELAIFLLVLCVMCLVTAFIAAKVLGYDIGNAPGQLVGGFTEPTVIAGAGLITHQEMSES
jgi:hypothetical protein